MKHLFLVDGSGFIFRAYHALPPLTTRDGTPTNAVSGFTSMMMKLIEDTDASHVAVILDAARKSFRNDFYPDYKAHRPPAPEDLVPQFPLIREAVRALNVPCIEMEGYEADDIIATYARQAAAQGFMVTVVSSDKDLMQLVDDRISLWDAMKNKAITRAEVIEKFGVPPEQVVDVQALCGDAADNVPGVPGIGIKTAAQLIGEFGTLEALLEQAGTIKQPKRRQTLLDNAELARVSKRLVTLCDTVPLAETIEQFTKTVPVVDDLSAFLERMEFRRLLAQVQGRAAAQASTPQAAASAAPSDVAYELVQDADRLRWWVAQAQTMVAIDTETTGLDTQKADLVGVSLALTPGKACYVPLAHVNPDGAGDLLSGGGAPPRQIPLAEALEILRPLLENPGVLKVGHNLKYDLHILRRAYRLHGTTVPVVAPVDDSMVLSYVLDGSLHGHGMDELAKLHLSHTTIPFSEVCGSGRSMITFDKVPLDKALAYAAEDADITLRLYLLLRERLLSERMVAVHETLDRPLVPLLFAMEQQGIKINALYLKELSNDFAGRMVELEKQIHALAGEEFNVGSPKQLAEILFEKMGLKGGKKGKTGTYSTNAEVLEELAAAGHDLPARVLDWRSIQKLKSTYTDALIAAMDEQQRVHTSFALTITSTGRLSSSDPNLQNIPIRTEEGRKIRAAFVAEPGYKILAADYSQIELRLMAHVADIPALRTAFAEDQDIHALTASQVFGVPMDGMDPMIRRRAKAINFGIIYGISAFGLARQLGISRGEAQAFIDAYFARFPEILAYMERTKDEARKNGFVRTLFGRKCFTPGIGEKNPTLRGFAERSAINAPIQGGAADIIKRAMIALPAALQAAGLQARLLLQVHDELVLEVPEAEADATAALVRQVMEGAASLSVPLVVETGVADTWAEAH
ncbi:DNA polymerase I [Insolitispirillum peregrinum]|uniref:DNA polymerase I n=1 Tax=Insolitispirillum peregrinum TaxID=80876 RepID=A0A1N7JAQ0_9PROT|nr:DNA polymerase I [Insolitispirillum peregrinum]SIS46433.1 DNA polymerase I [Insolitispirillum peregrinum]